MTKLDRLIAKHCPNGVEYKALGEIAKISNGKDHKLLTDGDIPVYGSGGIMRYANQFIYDEQSVLIPRKGSIGNVFYVDIPFWTVDTIFYTQIDVDQIIPKFLYYFLLTQHLEDLNIAGGVPSLTKSVLDKIKIPVPPLLIQQEIVRILDKFTALEAELEAELEARRKQYEYYRNTLLTFDEKTYIIKTSRPADQQTSRPADQQTSRRIVHWMTLGNIAEYRRGSFPQPYGESRWYGGEGAMPFVQVADVSEEGMRLVEKTKQQISKAAQSMSVFVQKGTVIISLQGSIGRVAITQYDSYVDRTLAIFKKYKIKINKKYFAYQLERKFSIEKEYARGSTLKTITKEEFTKFEIPIPSLEEQERIVSILDRFDALTNDITSGLPAEIVARRKQYEYYRDKLLTFKEAA
jgi:type I restriction enzyme S subunit